MNDFGHQIARLRASKGWNQTELARAAGLSPGHISQIESGKRHPNFTTTGVLADALGVKLDELRRRRFLLLAHNGGAG